MSAPWRTALALLVTLGGGFACRRAETPEPAPAPMAAALAQPSFPSPVSTDATRAAVLRGELPAGPQADALNGRCTICHTTQYLAQQRITVAQWEKTLKKMKGWGAPVQDSEVEPLALYLGTHFAPSVGPAQERRVPPPAGVQ